MARDGVSDRVRAAMRRKAVKGEVLGRPPYGYKVGSARRLELVPEEAVVVRYIFRLYLQEDMGIRLIARRLNEEGLKTRRGGNWSMVSIRDILRNRAYLGTYSRFDVHVQRQPSVARLADGLPQRAGSPEQHAARATRRACRRSSCCRGSRTAATAATSSSASAASSRGSGRAARRSSNSLPLLPVRVAHEPERLRLSHAPRGGAGGRWCGRNCASSAQAMQPVNGSQRRQQR